MRSSRALLRKGPGFGLIDTPAEGKLVQGFEGLDVGAQVRVQLTSLDVQRGFIDFKRISSSKH